MASFASSKFLLKNITLTKAFIRSPEKDAKNTTRLITSLILDAFGNSLRATGIMSAAKHSMQV